jgi:type VI protein secretion system component Hcp
LTKFFDKASHLIHKSAYLKAETDGSANNVVSAEVVVCSTVIPGSDEAPSRIMSILFKDGRIDKVDLTSSENAGSIKVEETLKMNFRQVKYSFFKRSESGGSRTTAQDFEWKSKLQTLDDAES